MTGDRMSAAVSPQVVDYLRALDTALARLPRDDAAELRQQIVEHLDEAVGPDTEDQQVAEILQRLGQPEELVAESLGAKPRRWLPRVRRWGWRRWTTLAIVLALVGSGVGYVVDMAVQPALQSGCQPCSFYYPQDVKHQHSVDSLTGDEMVTTDRPGQLQGVVFTIQNTSNWPETILGADHPSLGGPSDPTVAIGTVSPERDGLFRSIPFQVAPVVIPPGQYRYLRMTWRSAHCWLARGGTVGTDTFGFRVKIGWFTHVQNLQLQETVALLGVAQPNCP